MSWIMGGHLERGTSSSWMRPLTCMSTCGTFDVTVSATPRAIVQPASSFNVEDAVTVYPSPEAGFTIPPGRRIARAGGRPSSRLRKPIDGELLDERWRQPRLSQRLVHLQRRRHLRNHSNGRSVPTAAFPLLGPRSSSTARFSMHRLRSPPTKTASTTCGCR